MNNKEIKGFFSIQQTGFFAHIISRKQNENQQKQLRSNVFHVKTSPSAKNQLDPAKKIKISPKKRYTPFLYKSIQ